MEEKEIRKVRARFWMYLLLSYLSLTEFKDSILELYEIYINSGNEINFMTGSIIVLFWIVVAKSMITSTIREFKTLRNFKSDGYIQNEDEDNNNL